MKTIERILRTYVNVVAIFSKEKAAQISFGLFQQTQRKKLNKQESDFYNNTSYFEIETEIEKVKVYELGAENDELVFLVHGWNSNAGSMVKIAQNLVKEGFHCILFDLPAHEKSSLNRTNMKACSIVFESILKRIRQEKPIHVVAHSFGSAVSAYTLSRMNIKVNKLVYLTTPHALGELFIILKDRLALSNEVYNLVVNLAENLLEQALTDVTSTKKNAMIDYQKMVLMHDKHDIALPYAYSEMLYNATDNSELITYERIGHYRMLSNEALIQDIIIQLEEGNLTKSIAKNKTVAA